MVSNAARSPKASMLGLLSRTTAFLMLGAIAKIFQLVTYVLESSQYLVVKGAPGSNQGSISDAHDENGCWTVSLCTYVSDGSLYSKGSGIRFGADSSTTPAVPTITAEIPSDRICAPYLIGHHLPSQKYTTNPTAGSCGRAVCAISLCDSKRSVPAQPGPPSLTVPVTSQQNASVPGSLGQSSRSILPG
jgi:hypothetical protein